MKEEEKLPA
jgi:GTPase SAR1 family protein